MLQHTSEFSFFLHVCTFGEHLMGLIRGDTLVVQQLIVIAVKGISAGIFTSK